MMLDLTGKALLLLNMHKHTFPYMVAMHKTKPRATYRTLSIPSHHLIVQWHPRGASSATDWPPAPRIAPEIATAVTSQIERHRRQEQVRRHGSEMGLVAGARRPC